MAQLGEHGILWSYLVAALVPSLVFIGFDHGRGRWIAAAVFAHLALANLFNRVVWPALRESPQGVDGIPSPGTFMRGSRAEFDARMVYLHEKLAFSFLSSLVVIAVL